MKVKNHSAAAVSEAIAELKQSFGAHFSDIFKTITADNGSEFAALSVAEETGTSVYFTHPFSSREKGTNACHNKLLRRFIPKGKRISAYSPDDILHFADLMNALPRNSWLPYPGGVVRERTRPKLRCLTIAAAGFLRSGFALSPQSHCILPYPLLPQWRRVRINLPSPERKRPHTSATLYVMSIGYKKIFCAFFDWI